MEVPPHLSLGPDATSADLMNWVYEGFETVQPAQWATFYSDRAVVTPTNEAADALNDAMQSSLNPDTEIRSLSIDSVASECIGAEVYSDEFLPRLATWRHAPTRPARAKGVLSHSTTQLRAAHGIMQWHQACH